MKPPPLYGDEPILAKAKTRWVTTVSGHHLRLAIWQKGMLGTVHIFNGRTEYIEKYADVITQLQSRGFAVTCHDWYGQGLSDRNDHFPNRCHVDDFSVFQECAQAIMQSCKSMPEPRRLFCHSMGGAIGLRYLMGENAIESAVFSAPMWGIYMPLYLRPFVGMIRGLVAKYDAQWRCVIGTHEEPYESYTRARKNLLTSNLDAYRELGDRLKNFPELGLGGPTYYWLMAALQEIEALQSETLPNTPSLVFIGSNERVVDPKKVKAITSKNQNMRLIEISGARHEIYLEKPEIQKQLWSHIDSFWLTR